MSQCVMWCESKLVRWLTVCHHMWPELTSVLTAGWLFVCLCLLLHVCLTTTIQQRLLLMRRRLPSVKR